MKKNKTVSDLKKKKLHFIGIGGIGMSALARYFFKLGFCISGSDKENSPVIDDLKKEGINNVWASHSRSNIEGISPDIVVFSTAVTQTNEELHWAKENNKEILHRSALLEIATNEKILIAVSGTHGKTTTTAMIYEALSKEGLSPSVILGGMLQEQNTNSILGKGDYFIAEADESDKSLLKGNPDICIITNIEPDHLENYPGGLNEIIDCFIEFAKKGLANSGLVACTDDLITEKIITENFKLNNPKLITYGIKSRNCLLKAKPGKDESYWDIYFKDNFLISFRPKTPGLHNVLNSLAVIATSILLKADLKKITEALENYGGVKRRFQFLIKSKDISIVDDYAHHPTEIKATYEMAKLYNPKDLLLIFQPHQPRRLKDLWAEFIKTFQEIDLNTTVLITDTYIARGTNIEGISSKSLVKEINRSNISYMPGSIEELTNSLKDSLIKSDFILIMGAGNITNLGENLLNFYRSLASISGNN